MTINLNSVTYGNPSSEQKKIIEASCLTEQLFLKLKDFPFPANDSELVKDELNEMVDYTLSMATEENDQYLKRYKSYDRNILHVIISTFKQKGIDIESLCLDINNDIQPLILNLKYFYQRPRPSQIAQYYNLGLYPIASHSAQSPSYPSATMATAFVVLTTISHRYPTHYSFCKEMIKDVALSRYCLGLNFNGDMDFAKTIAQEILKYGAFAMKYEI